MMHGLFWVIVELRSFRLSPKLVARLQHLSLANQIGSPKLAVRIPHLKLPTRSGTATFLDS